MNSPNHDRLQCGLGDLAITFCFRPKKPVQSSWCRGTSRTTPAGQPPKSATCAYHPPSDSSREISWLRFSFVDRDACLGSKPRHSYSSARLWFDDSDGAPHEHDAPFSDLASFWRVMMVFATHNCSVSTASDCNHRPAQKKQTHPSTQFRVRNKHNKRLTVPFQSVIFPCAITSIYPFLTSGGVFFRGEAVSSCPTWRSLFRRSVVVCAPSQSQEL
jgi:hypothetical protein